MRFMFDGMAISIKYCRAPVSREFCVVGPEASKYVWSKEWDRLSFGAVPPWNHTDHVMDKVPP